MSLRVCLPLQYLKHWIKLLFLGILREEKLGVEYLLEQSGIILPSDDDHLNREIDEGFEDGLMEEISETPDPIPYSYTTEEIQTIGPIVQEDEEVYHYTYIYNVYYKVQIFL